MHDINHERALSFQKRDLRRLAYLQKRFTEMYECNTPALQSEDRFDWMDAHTGILVAPDISHVSVTPSCATGSKRSRASHLQSRCRRRRRRREEEVVGGRRCSRNTISVFERRVMTLTAVTPCNRMRTSHRLRVQWQTLSTDPRCSRV